MNETTTASAPEILVFGEILFDLFPDRACCGGAPLNLAVHLTRLGENVGLISAIGNGTLGVKAKKILAEQNISRSMIATVKYLTGSVNITLDEAKIPSYHFCGDCAYDHIPMPANLPTEARMLCFGTLAQRSVESRETLAMIRSRVNAPVFVDVNLRQDYYSREILENSLLDADIVKINDEELTAIAGIFGFAETPEAMAEYFHVTNVIETMGASGCRIWEDGKTCYIPASPAEVVSTVGAGDAFSAGYLHCRLQGADMAEAAAFAGELAARTTEIPGAF